MVPEDDTPVVTDDEPVPGGDDSGDEDTPYTSSMEEEWELWENLLNMSSESAYDARELAIEQSIEAFLNGMEEDPAYQKDAVVEGEVTPLIVSRTSALECDIKAPPGTEIYIGDMVGCFDEDWIVVELYADKIGIINGKMWICNDTIRFQNHSPTIYTRRVVIDDGSYTKHSTDPIAYVPTNTYKVYISMEPASIQLYIDKRLGFGPIFGPEGKLILEVYKITGIDVKSRNRGEGSHLMVMTVQRDVYNESNDSIELNLCDVYRQYSDETPLPPPEEAIGSCFIEGRDLVRIGTSRKYTGLFIDFEGNVVDGEDTKVWNVQKGHTAIERVINGDEVTITVPFNEDLIGAEVTLTLSDSEGRYGAYEKKVRVVTVG